MGRLVYHAPSSSQDSSSTSAQLAGLGVHLGSPGMVVQSRRVTLVREVNRYASTFTYVASTSSTAIAAHLAHSPRPEADLLGLGCWALLLESRDLRWRDP